MVAKRSDAFMSKCYGLRQNGERAEQAFVIQCHKSLFGESGLGHDIMKARVYYKLVLNDMKAGHPVNKVLYKRAKALIAHGKLDPELEMLFGILKQSKQQKGDRIMSENENAFGKKRIDCMGYAVTAILRWMGANGFSTAQAKAAMASMGVEVSPVTCSIQVSAGRKGDSSRGPVPDLTKDEIATLRSHIPAEGARPAAQPAPKKAPKKAPKPAPTDDLDLEPAKPKKVAKKVAKKAARKK